MATAIVISYARFDWDGVKWTSRQDSHFAEVLTSESRVFLQERLFAGEPGRNSQVAYHLAQKYGGVVVDEDPSPIYPKSAPNRVY